MLSYSARDSYWKAFRTKAHRLLGEGYRGAQESIRQKEWEEDDITGLITEQIENRLGELNFTPEYANFQVQEQRPVNQQGRHGKHRQKIDIVIRCPQKGTATLFAFEAKRLRTNGLPVGLYTGDEGMGCFLNDEYAEDMPGAGMIVYFQDKDEEYWEGELRRKLSVPLKAISVINTLPVEFQTTHVRKSGNKVELDHIFLDCCPV